MKIIIAHPAQQHSYRLAEALKREGYLFRYVTTVYQKKRSLTKLVTPMLPLKYRGKATGRQCDGLDDADVVQFCEAEGLLRVLAQYLPFLKKYHKKIYYHLADRFAKKVARYAIKNDVDAVITYDDCSPILFETLEKKSPHIVRILDMSAANRLYMKKIYLDDCEKRPNYALKLKQERGNLWDEKYLNRVKREIVSPNLFLCPSTFVAKSLCYSGILPNQMIIAPYGVDNKQFSMKKYDSKGLFPLRFVYVGGTKELKGVSYLIEAFNKVDENKATITIVGDSDLSLVPNVMIGNNIYFSGRIPHNEIQNILHESDVFIMPSLGEGLSLSALEAASCGLPLIVSENSGVNDLMTDGEEGFIVPIQSTESLVEKIEWFINNTTAIETMGKKAASMAHKQNWESYSKIIGDRIADEVIRIKRVKQ